MTRDRERESELAPLLPQIVPRAVAWATAQVDDPPGRAVRLSESLLELARGVGVREPRRIALRVVDAIPLPEDPLLHAAADRVGLTQPGMVGLTLGYVVFVRPGFEEDVRLLSHEFRHVAQCEGCGGMASFLAVHLPHLVAFGYDDAPFEVDARAHEVYG